MNLFQGQFYITGNLCSLCTLLCIQNASLTLASKVLLNLCALVNTQYMIYRVSKELSLLESEKLHLWHSVVAQ